MKKLNRNKAIWLSAALAALLALSSCGATASSAEQKPATPAEAASSAEQKPATPAEAAAPAESAAVLGAFQTKDIDGNDADQTIFAEYELTMVNIWATFCGPCLDEMPVLGELSVEYEEKGVRIVGLVADVLERDGTISQKQVKLAKEIVEKTGASYLHILPSYEMNDLMGSVVGVPTTLFVDKNGAQVGKVYVGARDGNGWRTAIDEALGQVAS